MDLNITGMVIWPYPIFLWKEVNNWLDKKQPEKQKEQHLEETRKCVRSLRHKKSQAFLYVVRVVDSMINIIQTFLRYKVKFGRQGITISHFVKTALTIYMNIT